MSSHAGSQDSQRLRGWIQDEPVEVLQAGSMSEEEQLVESLIKSIAGSLKPFPDRHSSPFLCFFGAGLLDRLQGPVIGPSFEIAAALRQWVAGTSC